MTNFDTPAEDHLSHSMTAYRAQLLASIGFSGIDSLAEALTDAEITDRRPR